jgi:hypothetical protein
LWTTRAASIIYPRSRLNRPNGDKRGNQPQRRFSLLIPSGGPEPKLDECFGLKAIAHSETLRVHGQGAIEEAPCFGVKVSNLSAYSAALLGVNLIEPFRAQDSIKAWSVLQKD